MAKKPIAEWTGVDPSHLDELERQLCRVRNRRRWFGGKESKIVRNAPSGMVGKLVEKAHDLIKEMAGADAVAQKGDLAKHLFKGKAKEADFSKFLNGKQQNRRWVNIGRRALAFLLVGVHDPILLDGTSKDKEAAARIDDYFFRGDKGEPKYFSEKRAASAHAWSYRELAGELLWAAREAKATKTSGGVWFVSGGPSFLDGDIDDRQAMLAGLVACLNTSLTVTLVHPLNATSAAADIGFLRTKDANQRLLVCPLANPLKSSVASFITPATRYLYLKLAQEQELWLLRGRPDDDDVEHGPRAYRGFRDEVQTFQDWLNEHEEELRPTEAHVRQAPSVPPERSASSEASTGT